MMNQTLAIGHSLPFKAAPATAWRVQAFNRQESIYKSQPANSQTNRHRKYANFCIDKKENTNIYTNNIILYDMHMRPNEQYVPMCVVIGSRSAIRHSHCATNNSCCRCVCSLINMPPCCLCDTFTYQQQKLVGRSNKSYEISVKKSMQNISSN